MLTDKYTGNIVRHNGVVTLRDRESVNGHKSGVVWFTGLPASGKSTIAYALERKLHEQGIRVYVLDGDNVRNGINSDLGFSRQDRNENLRRIVELSKLFVEAGVLILAAFISPFREDRAYVRRKFAKNRYFEVYVECSLAECEKRDPKGHYIRARAGRIAEYTGISSPYEEPTKPDMILNTEKADVQTLVNDIERFVAEKYKNARA
jgi:adenylylsulfate kinase